MTAAEQHILAQLRRWRRRYWEARRRHADQLEIRTWQEGRWAILADLYWQRQDRAGVARCCKHLPGGSMGRPA